MGSIVYDSRSGKLVKDTIWEFIDCCELNVMMHAGLAYGEWNGHEKKREIRGCPVDKKHITETLWQEVEINLFGGKVGDFVPLSNHGFNIISLNFANRLRASGLKGFEIREGVKVDVNQSEERVPKLFFLEVSGKGGVCKRWKIKDAPNLCPYCETEPISCPGCGIDISINCRNCAKQLTYYDKPHSKDSDGKRLAYEPKQGMSIVDGKDWDGSDCFAVSGYGGSWYVKRRAKDWFDRIHLLGSKFEPALLNVDGMKIKIP